MNISIKYCGMWNYKPKAASLAEEIKSKFGLEAELIEDKGGIFDVRFGDQLVFSKHEHDRFPEHQEVVDRLKELVVDQA